MDYATTHSSVNATGLMVAYGMKPTRARQYDKVVVIVDKKKASHFDRIEKRTGHFDAHKHAYRPDVKACTFKVSRHDSHNRIVARAEHTRGVMNTKWNPRTRELTVFYDAKVTSARHIMHSVA